MNEIRKEDSYAYAGCSFCDLTPHLHVLKIDPWEIEDKEGSDICNDWGGQKI